MTIRPRWGWRAGQLGNWGADGRAVSPGSYGHDDSAPVALDLAAYPPLSIQSPGEWGGGRFTWLGCNRAPRLTISLARGRLQSSLGATTRKARRKVLAGPRDLCTQLVTFHLRACPHLPPTTQFSTPLAPGTRFSLCFLLLF